MVALFSKDEENINVKTVFVCRQMYRVHSNVQFIFLVTEYKKPLNNV